MSFLSFYGRLSVVLRYKCNVFVIKGECNYGFCLFFDNVRFSFLIL